MTHDSMQQPAPVRDGGSLRGAIGLAVLSMAGLGFAYSLAGVAAGQLLFRAQAEGSMLAAGGRLAGSALVAQPVASPRYFHPRPSAAKYDPMNVAGSNMARSNPQLRERLDAVRAEVAAREGIAPQQVPGELITQSGGGIDPHLGPEAAQLQVARVARARGLAPGAVQALLERHVEGPTLGLLGQPRVNVLRLNLALDALAGPQERGNGS